MLKNKIYICIVMVLIIYMTSTGCTEKEDKLLNKSEPVVVTLWHSYNNYAKAVFDKLILQFNETEGAEKGIIIDAYAYGDLYKLEESLYNSCNKMIGSAAMPDIFMSYPDNAYNIDKMNELVDFSEYLTEEELEAYRPEFIEEGIWGNNAGTKLLPVAKSTEVFYLNKTDWDKFAKAENIQKSALNTWEGLMETAEVYYNRTGGKAMFGMNQSSDFVAVMAAQLGNEIFKYENGEIHFEYRKDTAKKLWDLYYVPHIKGWYKSSYYNQDGIKSGDLIAYIGSSAGAGYFPSEIILTADKRYPIECEVLEFPTFEGKAPYLCQRGAGMCVNKSDKKHEYAAVEFLKWFTEPEQNISFSISTGYIPVENEALESMDKILDNMAEAENSQALKSSVEATMNSISKNKFYAKKSFDNSYEINKILYTSIIDKMEMDLHNMEAKLLEGASKDELIADFISEENFEIWYADLIKKVSEQMKKQE